MRLDFPAERNQLPELRGKLSAEQQEALMKLHTLLQAVPWGCALPSVQFLNLGINPCHVHTLVGDTLWQACWGERHAAVTAQHAVPYKLMNVVKEALEALAMAPTDTQRTAGGTHYAAVLRLAETRKREGGPY